MSMTPGSEEFDALRRLLKLKRYEQPRPGYFNDLSRQVVARIRAGEGAGSASPSPELDISWLQALWGWFEGRPALAGLCGAAICVMLVVGVTYSGRVKTESPVSASQGTPPGQPMESAAMPYVVMQLPQERSVLISSTNPTIALPASGSLFDQIQNLGQPRAQTVNMLTPVLQPEN